MNINFQSKEGRTLDTTKVVRMYRNLNNGKLSVQQEFRNKQNKKVWYVVGWVDELQLVNVTTYFERWKQNKAVAEQVRNVHAYIVGYPVDKKAEGQNKELTYNPFKYSEFVDKGTKENIHQAETLHITKEGKMFYK